MQPKPVVCVGRNSVDFYYRSRNSFHIGEKILLEPLGYYYGGMIPNTATILSALGIQTILFDTIGEDEHTQPLLESLSSAGVDTRFIHLDTQYRTTHNDIILTDISGQATSTILIKDEPRCPYVISKEERSCLEHARLIYSTTRDLDALRVFDMSGFCKQPETSLVLYVEDIELSKLEKDEKYLHLADIIIFNLTGYQKLSQEFGNDIWTHLLSSRPHKLIVLTRGRAGCSVYQQGAIINLPGISVPTVDCTGAGDTFNAVLLAHILNGKTPEESARFANAAAAHSTTIIGPRSYLNILNR